MSNNGPVEEGSPATVIVAGQFDPSAADTVAGFSYQYDFDNNGTFEVSSNESTVIVPASYLDDDAEGPRVVRVRIEDKDSVGTEYTTEIVILNVCPSATFFNHGPVLEGSEAVVTMSDLFDPSNADLTAGLRFAFDIDQNGKFDDGHGDGTYAGSLPTRIEGDAGNDHLVGGSGPDHIVGGLGDDMIQGRGGDDFLDGGDGRDNLDGGHGNDILLGGAQDDRLGGNQGRDLLVGGAGRATSREAMTTIS